MRLHLLSMSSVLDTTARYLGAEFILGNRNALANAQRWDLADKGEPPVADIIIPGPQCCEQKKQRVWAKTHLLQ